MCDSVVVFLFCKQKTEVEMRISDWSSDVCSSDLLEQNYRCSSRVLRAANALIANNPHEHPKTLWSAQDDGERIRVWECRDGMHEAERVAGESHFVNQARGEPWRDFGHLFRDNHKSHALEQALQLLGVPTPTPKRSGTGKKW